MSCLASVKTRSFIALFTSFVLAGLVPQADAQSLNTSLNFSTDDVRSGTSFEHGPIAPGELITIEHYFPIPPNLTPLTLDQLLGESLLTTNVIPTLSNGVRVYFDGRPAPLLSANNLLTVEVPFELNGQSSTEIQVEINGVQSSPVTVPVVAARPSFYLPTAQMPNFGSIVAASGTFLPPGGVGGINPKNPAKQGDTIVFRLNGAGQMNPPGNTGEYRSSGTSAPVLPVSVTIGGKPAQIQSAIADPNEIDGIIDVILTVPNDAPTGYLIPIVATVGSFTSSIAATIAINSADGTALRPSDLTIDPTHMVSAADGQAVATIVPGAPILIARPQAFPFNGQELQNSGVASVGATTYQTTFAGMSATFNGILAPITVSPVTLTPQVIPPLELAGLQSVQMQVQLDGKVSNTLTLPVAQAEPHSQVSELDSIAGGSLDAFIPQSNTMITPDTPALRGGQIAFRVDGAGGTNPPQTDNQINASVGQAVLPVTVTIDGVPASLVSAGVPSGTAGLYANLANGFIQLVVQIPANARVGSQIPVVVTVGGVKSPESVTIPIQ